MSIRRQFIRHVTPVIWKAFHERQVSALQEFALIEKDSGCQLLHCQRRVSDPRIKGYLFQHVLEEFFHGEIFSDLAKQFSPRHLYEKTLPREELLDSSSDRVIRDFFAYVHVGERAVNRDFMAYAKAPLDSKVKSVFLRAGQDEGRHEKGTDDILWELCGQNRFLFITTLCRAHLKRAWKTFSHSMRSMGAVSLTVLLSMVYFVTGPLVAPSLRRRLSLSRQEQFEIFCDQVRDFEGRRP